MNRYSYCFKLLLACVAFLGNPDRDAKGDAAIDEELSKLKVTVEVTPKEGPWSEVRNFKITYFNGGKKTIRLFNPNIDRHLPKTISLKLYSPSNECVGDAAEDENGSSRPAVSDENWVTLEDGAEYTVSVPYRLGSSVKSVFLNKGRRALGEYSGVLNVLRLSQTTKPWEGMPKLVIDDETPNSRRDIIYKMRTRLPIEYPVMADRVLIASPEFKFIVTSGERK